jgi:hypothetical protein
VSDSLLTVGTLQAALASSMVVVTTDNASGTGAGIIQVVDPVTWTSDTSLTLNAAAGININAAISGGPGSRLGLRTASGDINQTAPISVVTLSARADAGSVNLTNAGNQVQQLAGFANGAGGFNFRNNSTSLLIGLAGPESGITSLGSGAININAAGDLMLLSPVSSQAGDIVLASGGTFINQSTVSATSGRVTVQGTVLQSSLADCTANPALDGCAAMLPTLAQCTSAPATTGCSAVLPTLAQCVSAPTAAGCSVVLPTLAQCTSAPATAGCSVVLPTLAQCTVMPTLSGCAVVLPTTLTSTNAPLSQSLNAAINNTVNLINTASSTVLLTQPTTASSAIAFLDTKKTDTKTADTKTTDTKTDKKSDDSDKPSVVKNESAVKKMYCN